MMKEFRVLRNDVVALVTSFVQVIIAHLLIFLNLLGIRDSLLLGEGHVLPLRALIQFLPHVAQDFEFGCLLHLALAQVLPARQLVTEEELAGVAGFFRWRQVQDLGEVERGVMLRAGILGEAQSGLQGQRSTL